MVDEYKNTNSHILKQCMRISEMLLINIPVGKLFEGLDFANEQVESLLLLLPLVVAASTIFGSLLLLCIICVFSCLWPQGLLLTKGGRRISDVCNSLVHAVHVKVSLALASLDERWLRRTEKWFSFFFLQARVEPLSSRFTVQRGSQMATRSHQAGWSTLEDRIWLSKWPGR